MQVSRRAAFLLLAAACGFQVSLSRAAEDPSLLTLERIYKNKEFDVEPYSGQWLDGQAAFTKLDKSAKTEGGRDIVRHDAATGQEKILVAAEQLIPAGAAKPLEVEGYAWSGDQSLLLIYTNSKRVWRQKTQGRLLAARSPA